MLTAYIRVYTGVPACSSLNILFLFILGGQPADTGVIKSQDEAIIFHVRLL